MRPSGLFVACGKGVKNCATVKASRQGYLSVVEGLSYDGRDIRGLEDVPRSALNAIAVVFKRVFTAEFVSDLRAQVVRADYPAGNYQAGPSGLTMNFKRIDDLRNRDRRAKYNVVYNTFAWNRETPAAVSVLQPALARFADTIGGRRPDERPAGADGKVASMIFFHYPAGGELNSHHFTDDLGGPKVKFDEIVIQFSKFGRDYRSGGVHIAPRFRMAAAYDPANHGELQFIEPLLDPGDILALTVKDCYHRVTPIDPDLDYTDPMKGRFIALSYYTSAEDLGKLAREKK
jgi:hypothetical protein